MYPVLILYMIFLSLPVFSSENFLEKVFWLSSSKEINRDVSRTIQLQALILDIQNISERIKILHYLAHQQDDHQQTLFRTIYSSDAKIMDSIASTLFNISQDKLLIEHRQALCKGDFLVSQEYSSQNTK